MRAALVTSFAYAAVIHVSNAFTHSATPVTVRPCTSAKRFPDTLYVQTSDKGERAIAHKNATPEQRKVLGNQLREDENSACEKSPYAIQMAALDDDTLINLMSSTQTSDAPLRQRLRYVGARAWERMNTMKAAGLCDNRMKPLQSGFKTNVGLLIGAFLFKWYRARFINKIPVWDRQPQWNMVITSPEQEKELHAYSCLKCGATIFIARHREWFFQGGNTVCTNCGAKGAENFVDVRGEVIESIDDDYFDYESPLDFVSAAERRKLVKQAGGDEELAKKLAIEQVMKNDKEQIKVEEKPSTGGDAEKTKKKKKKKSAPKEVPEDIFEELDSLM